MSRYLRGYEASTIDRINDSIQSEQDRWDAVHACDQVFAQGVYGRQIEEGMSDGERLGRMRWNTLPGSTFGWVLVQVQDHLEEQAVISTSVSLQGNRERIQRVFEQVTRFTSRKDAAVCDEASSFLP
jgi:hypothetical protein